MGRHPLLLQKLKHVVGHDVVDRALADDRPLFLPVERGRVILVIDDDQVRVVGRKHFLCLSFVHLLFLLHVHFLHLYV